MKATEFLLRYQASPEATPVELVMDHRKADWAKVAERIRTQLFPGVQPKKEKPWTSKRAR